MSLPLDHLSASSLSLFQRCPRQWQERYLREKPSPASSAIVVGSAVHLGLSRILKGEDPGNFFEDAVAEHTEGIIWQEKQETAKTWAEKMLYSYYQSVGRYLSVISTEQEILIQIPGVDIPVLGYVDIEREIPAGIIDVKTTKYFQRKPELNPEWKLQMNIYQIEYPDPGEFHVITRSKSDPVVIPSGPSSPLYVPVPNTENTINFIQQTYSVMKHYYEEWGAEIDWPGNLVHPWASRYCSVVNCCQRS